MTGAWDSDELVDFLSVLASQMESLISPRLQRLRAVAVRRIPRRHRNTRAGARRNISHHYDLSNELFGLFLDPSLTYSSAVFDADRRRVPGGAGEHWEAGPPRYAAEPGELQRAQARKIDRLLDQADVAPGSRVLEIGTGWGELAIRAALRGATVRSVTLSAEQKELADQRIAAAGMADRVTVELCDYRDVEGVFDAVVSVEMIEAVGWQFWPTYFEKVDALLRPGGRFALQAITLPHDRMLATRDTHTWITKYIFPGGALPSLRAIDEIVRGRTSLRAVSQFDIGLHYAATLRSWADRFEASHEDVMRLGFDATFVRMWFFYLAYCEAGFAARYIDVNQLTFVKGEAP
jgi:cyclopropane-fatty-acyl-phospholipid synthase